MKTFGDLLRYHREQTKTANGKHLSQGRLADALGYTTQSVSGWERNKNQPSKDDTRTLQNLIKVLYAHGGIQSLAEAEALLAAGNYRSLSKEQVREIDPSWVEAVESNPLPTPYLGLAAFEEGDADFFFGRTLPTQQLTTLIQQYPVVTLIGAAGSGKSSLVQAGMLPLLRKSAEWQVATVHAGSPPFYALAAALVSLLEPELDATERPEKTERLAESLDTGHVTLTAAIQAIPQPLLLIFDDWDQLYRDCSVEQRQQVVAMLTSAAQTYSTLRYLFVARTIDQLPTWLLPKRTVELSQPLQRDLQAMIIEPAKRQNIEVEPQLVAHLLDKLEGQPGALPLLAYVMRCVWDKRKGATLTFADYLNQEAIEGLFSDYADTVYRKLSTDQQHLVKKTFLQLVYSDDQQTFKNQDVPQQYFKLEEMELVRRLADARLVTIVQDASDQVVVRLAHTMLAQQWPTLRQWILEADEFWDWQRRLRIGLRQWEDEGREEHALLAGRSLRDAMTVRVTHAGRLSPVENAFILESGAVQQKLLWHRRLAFSFATLLICLGSLIMFHRQRTMEARRHFEEAQILLDDGEYAEALQRGLQAVAVWDSAETNAKLADIWLASPHIQAYLRADSADFTDFILLPDQQLIATHLDGTLSFWNTAIYTTTQTIESPHLQGISQIARSPDHTAFATAGIDGSIALWRVGAAQPYHKIDAAHNGTILALAFAPQQSLLASGGADGVIYFWDTNSGELVEGGGDVGGIVRDMVFALDGTLHIVTQSRQWIEWRDGLLETTPYATVLSSIALFHGETIVGDTVGRVVHPMTPLPVETSLALLHALAVDADRSLLAVGGCLVQDVQTSSCVAGGVHVWPGDAFGTDLYHVMVGLTGAVKSVSFSADGSHLFALTSRQIAILHNVQPTIPQGYAEWEPVVCTIAICSP